MFTTLKTLKKSLKESKVEELKSRYHNIIKDLQYLKSPDFLEMNPDDLSDVMVEDFTSLSINEFITKYYFISSFASSASVNHPMHMTRYVNINSKISNIDQVSNIDCADILKYNFQAYKYIMPTRIMQDRMPFFQFICKAFDFELKIMESIDEYTFIAFSIPKQHKRNSLRHYFFFQLFRYGFGHSRSRGNINNVITSYYNSIFKLDNKFKSITIDDYDDLFTATLLSSVKLYDSVSEKSFNDKEDGMLETVSNVLSIWNKFFYRSTTFSFISYGSPFVYTNTMKRISIGKSNMNLLFKNKEISAGGGSLHSKIVSSEIKINHLNNTLLNFINYKGSKGNIKEETFSEPLASLIKLIIQEANDIRIDALKSDNKSCMVSNLKEEIIEFLRKYTNEELVNTALFSSVPSVSEKFKIIIWALINNKIDLTDLTNLTNKHVKTNSFIFFQKTIKGSEINKEEYKNIIIRILI